MTAAEQEYIKQIYLGETESNKIMRTRDLAELIGARPSSATDMVKRLTQKGLLIYRKNHGFSLSDTGLIEALKIVRRHRLWELFLTDQLKIDWKEVHGMASELQSLSSDLLINQLEAYLGYPIYDPHGEAIPDVDGNLPLTERMEVYDLKVNQQATVISYRDTSKAFLSYMEKLGLLIGRKIKIRSLVDYNHSIEIGTEQGTQFIITKETAQKIYVNTNGNNT